MQLLRCTNEERLKQDEKTVMAMAVLYCHGHHHMRDQNKTLCSECADLASYSLQRTRRCPQKHQGTCDTCSIQCYKPAMRQKIREMMSYSGPRMLLHHPFMAIRHLHRKRKSRKENHGHIG